MNQPQAQPIPWREMVAVLHRRRTFILQVFLGCLITVAVCLWLQGPTYRAAATLMVTSDRAQVVVSPDADTRPTVERVTEQDMNSEAALIRSESLVREVLEAYWHGGDDDQPTAFQRVMTAVSYPFQLPSILYRKIHGIPPVTGLDGWVQGTLANLGINLVGKSNLIEVSFSSSNPKWAAELVNKIVTHHLERRAKLNQQSETRRFYETQRQVLADKSQAAEAALEAFNRREGMDSMSPAERQALRTRLVDLQTTLANSETELSEGTARVKFLENEIKDHPRNIPTEAKVAQNQQYIQPKILELQLQRSELLSRYAPTSVKVRDIDRQIAEAKQLMANTRETLAETTSAVNPAYQNLEVDLAQTKAQMAAVGARVEALRAQIATHKATVAHLDEVSSEQERLEQDVATAKEAFLTYSKKAEEARFSTALDESTFVDIAIAEPAEVPTSPEKSKQAMILMLGAVMSLVSAVGLAFLRDRLDPAVKSAAEAESATGLPILAEVR